MSYLAGILLFQYSWSGKSEWIAICCKISIFNRYNCASKMPCYFKYRQIHCTRIRENYRPCIRVDNWPPSKDRPWLAYTPLGLQIHRTKVHRSSVLFYGSNNCAQRKERFTIIRDAAGALYFIAPAANLVTKCCSTDAVYSRKRGYTGLYGN